MSLHRLAQITIGVPDVAQVTDYYSEFGLTDVGDGLLATAEGGNQLRILQSPRRRLLAMTVGVDDLDDIARATRNLTDAGYGASPRGRGVVSVEPVADIEVTLDVMPRLRQDPVPAPLYNGPGRFDRVAARAPGVLREGRVRPKKLGHVVAGTVDIGETNRFFERGIGFKVSDAVGDKGVFMRCSTDHHNLMLLQMPIAFLHHTSWQVDDIDEVGRGAQAMLESDPSRHVWGLGRHHAGSNFFWYLKDPAGNFSEYYSDMDCIPEDEIWTPEVLEGAKGLFNWGPPPPPSFLAPDDLGALMSGAHAS
jgi:catechol 2,3-dioxygenase-like lactoylglutathione lyase family enzyme